MLRWYFDIQSNLRILSQACKESLICLNKGENVFKDVQTWDSDNIFGLFGYIVGGVEMKIDPSKVEFIQYWSTPTNVT